MIPDQFTWSARAFAGALALLATLGGLPVAGQQEAPANAAGLAFEVTSVRRTPPLASGAVSVRLGGLQGNRWSADGVTLLMLIRSAYGQQYAMQGQIVGGPPWLETERFTVTAVAHGVPTEDEARLMLQRLLADRFHLVVRQERRELPVYALTLARSDGSLGPELKSAGVDCEALMQARKRGEAPPAPPVQITPEGAPPPCTTMMMMGPGMMRIRSGGATAAQLAQSLSSSAGRPVLDRTGLSGYYAYSVEFAREPGSSSPLGGPPLPLPAGPLITGAQGSAPAIAGPIAPAAAATAPASDLPSVFAAVEEQLGLKLEPRRELADVLVIVNAEPPTED